MHVNNLRTPVIDLCCYDVIKCASLCAKELFIGNSVKQVQTVRFIYFCALIPR